MRSATLFLTAAAAAFTTASPLLHSRAGGPIATPIPANCTTLNPLPHANCGVANVSGYQVSAAFTSANALYSAYFPATMSAAAEADFCFQQCNGFSGCKAAVSAANVPTPAGYYGTAGGDLEQACLFFGEYLSPNDFVPAPEGQYVNETAVGIYCPASA